MEESHQCTVLEVTIVFMPLFIRKSQFDLNTPRRTPEQKVVHSETVPLVICNNIPSNKPLEFSAEHARIHPLMYHMYYQQSSLL